MQVVENGPHTLSDPPPGWTLVELDATHNREGRHKTFYRCDGPEGMPSTLEYGTKRDAIEHAWDTSAYYEKLRRGGPHA